ncbi:cysteine desulfurase [Salinisphaera sp. USBA-960]|uniref:cysteine desulfurase family protein n=1 Tax=Salinisphaera orenii TaxID=856731 RepID=UPI0013A67259|nr:cysteine desulfurase [Salifodinibacter halophilus]NNC25768.1 cysteine desulfurase [Salifodinibacter halophilus]
MTNSDSDLLYLDHAANTPVVPAACTAMGRSLERDVANADGVHPAGRGAAEQIDQAAIEVAAALNGEPESLVWTSGATESIDLALSGATDFYGGDHVVTWASEHRATLDVTEQLARRGVGVTTLDVDARGHPDLDALEHVLADGVTLVSIAHVNNETGVVAPLARIGALCKRYGALFHIDAAQSVGRLPIDVDAVGASLVSVSAHKIGGPTGIGALYIRRGVGVTPQLRGGGQQDGRRGGTRPTHQIVGMGAAVGAVRAGADDERARLEALDARLWQQLAAVPGVTRNGAGAPRAPGFINVSVSDIHGKALLAGLNEGSPALAVSAGSACSAATHQSSHVLRAMGVSPDRAAASVRFSLGWTTDESTVDNAAWRFADEVARLRALASAA